MIPRRTFSIVLALAVAIASSPARGAEKLFPAGKMFPLLAQYLALPVAARDRFAPIYVLHAKSGSLAGAKVWLVLGDRRTPLTIAPDGQISHPATVADLKRGQIAASFPPDSKIGVRVDIVATTPLRNELSTAAMQASLNQANAAMPSGIPFLSRPRLRRVVFAGSAGGEVVGVDGRRVALPMGAEGPYYEPSAASDDLTIHLRRTPSAILLEADH